MIVEIADFRVEPKDHEAFGEALQRAASTVLAKATGYQAHSILACIETQGRYVLTVNWDTVGDHTQGFRGSPAFADWRAIIGPFFAQPPHVEHFTVLS